MKRIVSLTILLVVSTLVFAAPALSQDGPPAWAYPVNSPDFKPSPDDGTLRRVPDSDLALTLTQVRDFFYAADWHPADHPSDAEGRGSR